jgi:hypothetical protein
MPPLRGSPRVKDWLFTCFFEGWEPPPDVHQHVQYLVYQKEQAPTTNRVHLQGFVIFKQRHTLKAAQELLHLFDVHMEPRRGTRAEARQYCMKQDTRLPGEIPREIGQFPGSRQIVPATSDLNSNDGNDQLELPSTSKYDPVWLRLIQDIQHGATIKDVIQFAPHFCIRHMKGIYELFKLFAPVRSEMTVGIWLYGPSGIGKSFMAKRIADKYGPAYWKPPASKWFDGYDSHPVCIIDDYRPCDEGIDFAFLLRLVDRYPCKVEVKHGTVEFVAKYVVVTTPCSPRDTFCSVAPSQMDQIYRRFIYQFDLSKEDERDECVKELKLESEVVDA